MMKKLLLASSLITLLSIAVNAQEEGELRASAGLALGSESALNDDGDAVFGFGVNLGAEIL